MKQKDKNSYGMSWIFRRTKGTRPQLLLYTVLVLCVTVIQISLSYFLKAFVDVATGDLGTSLLLLGGLAIAVIGVGGIFTMLASVLSKYIYGKTERSLRTELLSVILSRKMRDISSQHTGELHTKLTADTQAVSQCFPLMIENMVGGIASALISITAMFFLSWKMALIMLILMPLLMLIMGIITPFIQKASMADKENDEANRSMMQEYLSRIMLIKAYFMQDKIAAKVQSSYEKKLKSGMKLGLWEGLAAFLGLLVSMSMFMVALGFGAYFVMQGETTLGSLIAIVQLLNYIVSPLEKLSGTISQVSQAVASSDRIGTIYELAADKAFAKAQPADAVELVAENVSFSYNEADNILENMSVSFKKGEITGIVGESGAGKSTLLKLLIGVYEPRQGSVMLKTASGSPTEILPQVAYVPPDDYLFSGTVAENIVMSANKPDMAGLESAAADANILEFILSLPEGFNTSIGEGGSTVSSGQAQRLAIARAIYKNSPVVIFDEPTANLDAQSIEQFKHIVRELDKICIIVTHDVSTIGICDKVYVMEEGHVNVQSEGKDNSYHMNAENISVYANRDRIY